MILWCSVMHITDVSHTWGRSSSGSRLCYASTSTSENVRSYWLVGWIIGALPTTSWSTFGCFKQRSARVESSDWEGWEAVSRLAKEVLVQMRYFVLIKGTLSSIPTYFMLLRQTPSFSYWNVGKTSVDLPTGCNRRNKEVSFHLVNWNVVTTLKKWEDLEWRIKGSSIKLY